MTDRPIRVAILSRYQKVNTRGVERVVEDLSKYLNKSEVIRVDILSGKDADKWSLLRGKYDVVIPTNGRMQSLVVSWGRFIGGYKVLITGHSGLGWDDLWNLMVARPSVFVALTRSTLSNWRMRVGRWLALGVRVEQIPNGVDLEKYKPLGRKMNFGLSQPVVLSVGALVAEKRHRLAIEAVSKLDNISLVIVGGGPLKKELEDLGNRKLKDRFKMMSASLDEMPDIYRGANLFTLPSWDREAFGVVYLEAMATNLVVVAPDDASRHEIVGNAGVYVDVMDRDKYAEAINQALKKDWGVEPRKRAEKFDWAGVAGRYAELISSLRGRNK